MSVTRTATDLRAASNNSSNFHFTGTIVLMKQYEAVIQTLERLGGQSTLGLLYQEVIKEKNCEWKTKTPFASIRRIVQVRPEIFKVRPGLWALRSYQKRLGLEDYQKNVEDSEEIIEQTHSYYQGLILEIGNLRGFQTFSPNQDRNRRFLNKILGEIRTLQTIPNFGYGQIVQKASSIDVSWFNNRKMPYQFFEIEHSTNFINSMMKFYELQDFSAKMSIVASENRRGEFIDKSSQGSLKEIRTRINFLSYDDVVTQHESEIKKVNFF